MTSLLSTLREVTPDRHNRAVQGLANHSLAVKIISHSDAQIRAVVTSSGNEYRVILMPDSAFCGCPDAFFHGRCKHIAAVCITCLQGHGHNDAIHLMHDNDVVLCGETQPQRYWLRWTWNALNWPDVCPQCLNAWTHRAVAA